MHITKNTLNDNTRKASIALLQARLYEAVDLSTQARQAHWNVKGPNFIALHDLFEQIYTQVSNDSDILAERITTLGGQANGTARAASEHSSLNEYPLEASKQQEHIEALGTALAVFGGNVRLASDEAATVGDQDTSDLFTEISRSLAKSLWLVESHAG